MVTNLNTLILLVLIVNILTDLNNITLTYTVNNMLRVQAESETAEIRLNDIAENTILILITYTHREFRQVVTTCHIQRMVGYDGILIANCINPICTCIRTILVCIQQICINILRPIISRATIIVRYLVLNSHILLCSQQLRLLIHILPTHVSIIRNLNLAHLTLFGSYKDYTIGCGRTVDGTRCGILQYVDTLDVGRVQSIDVTTRNSINYIKRSGRAVGTGTTDRNLKAITRLTGSRLNVYTRSLALQGAQHLSGIHLLNIITLHLDGRTGNELLLLNTITYDNNFFESLVVCLHCDVKIRLITYNDFLLLITDISNNNSSTRLHVQDEVTIQVGNCTISGITFLYYTCTDDRTFCVTYITGNLLRLLY